jgi:hypothetical protein
MRFDLDPPEFLREASETEGWSSIDERHCLVLCRQLDRLGTKSLWLSHDSEGWQMLTADAGRPSEEQRARLSDLHPKATLDALYRLTGQLRAADRKSLVSKT